MKISYKIVMGFSISKSLVEVEIYQISSVSALDNNIILLINYGDGSLAYEYMEMNTEDSKVMTVLLGILLEKMELRTPVMEASLKKMGFEVEDFTS